MSNSSRSDAQLEIRVLGPLQVLVDRTPLRVDTRKALAIVALLAVDGRPYAREELAAVFWPESDDESARGALRRTLSVLKTALGNRWLRIDRSTVGLDVAADGVWLDLAALQAGAASSDRASLADAASLARGPFLAGFSLRDSPDFDDWRATRATAAERHVVEVLERLASVAEAEGDVPAATTAAGRLVELDPLDEPARRRLMALLVRGGDWSGAIRQYRATVAVLERELGVAPLTETTELYEAIRDERQAPRSPTPALASGHPVPIAPPTVPTRLPMVGRDEDLRRLLAAHGAAVVDGRIARITGEAGIGKSRLAEALAAEVSAMGGRVLSARSFPAEGSIAYAPIVDLLRTGFARDDAGTCLAPLPGRVLGEVERLVALPEGLAPGSPAAGGDQRAARARLLDAIAATLTALATGPVPGLVVVEDLQWADDASREALLYLARRLSGKPLLLLLTWRPEDLDGPAEAFPSSIDAAGDGTAIRLDRLATAAVAELVAAAAEAGWPAWETDALLAESEGLPLYVVEALLTGPGAAREAGPRSVRALLRERLARVGETASQVLAAGAVIGRSFDLETVHGASGRSEDETITALEELVRRAIVREVESGGGPAFDFGHARLRDAAYEEIGLARRRLLHRRVAEVLRADVAARDEPGRLAQIAAHELAAGREAAAAEAFYEAGTRARRVFANREALDHLETALALGYPDVAGLQVAIGEARTALGDYVGAVAAFEAAAALTSEADLPGIELLLARVHARRGDLVTAASHLDAALDGVAAAGEGGLVSRILVERSVVAVRAGDLDLAATTAREALARADAAGDVSAGGAAYRVLGLVARARGDLSAACDALTRSLALAASDPDPSAAIAAGNALALVEADTGDHAAAIARLETALDACRRTGERHLEAAVENNLADQLHAVGQTELSMGHLKRAVALFAEIGGRPGELEPEIWKLVAW